MEYRVLQKGEYFYPQYKFLIFWITFEHKGYWGNYHKEKFIFKGDAINFIRRKQWDIKKSTENIIKIHEVD